MYSASAGKLSHYKFSLVKELQFFLLLFFSNPAQNFSLACFFPTQCQDFPRLLFLPLP
jgi:hypothetical protein